MLAGIERQLEDAVNTAIEMTVSELVSLHRHTVANMNLAPPA